MLTRRAGVRVPSTSKRQMVFLTGRSVSAGMTLAAGAVVAMVCCCGVATGISFCMRMYVYGSELLKSVLNGGVMAQKA